jgi:hypothetical protein
LSASFSAAESKVAPVADEGCDRSADERRGVNVAEAGWKLCAVRSPKTAPKMIQIVLDHYMQAILYKASRKNSGLVPCG